MSSIERPVTKIANVEEGHFAMRQITVDPHHFQTRATTNIEVVRLYAKAMAKGSPFPPVEIIRTPDGRHVLSDGFHRYAARKSLRLPTILAVIREGTEEDAVLEGIRANFRELLNKPTDDDRVHAAKLMLRNEAFRQWSDKAIAEAAGVSSPTVLKIRVALFAKEGIPIPDRVLRFTERHPEGILIKYGNARGAHRISKNAVGGLKMWFEGKVISLGRDEKAAIAKRDQLLSARRRGDFSLRKSGAFPLYLAARSIHAEPLGGLLGGYRVADAAVLLAPDCSPKTIGDAAFSALISRHEDPTIRRAIVACRLDAITAHAFARVRLGRMLSPPVEFLTPEQIVAEFGGTAEDAAPAETEGDPE